MDILEEAMRIINAVAEEEKELGTFVTVEFSYGVGVKDTITNKWTDLILDNQKSIDLTDMNVILTEEGIKFKV